MLSLGHNGGIMLWWWYSPGHITVVIVTSCHKQGGPWGVVVGMTRISSSFCHRCHVVVVPVVRSRAHHHHKVGDLGQGVLSPHCCMKVTWGASSSHLSYCCLIGIGCGTSGKFN